MNETQASQPAGTASTLWVGVSDGPSGVFVAGIWADPETAKRESSAIADPNGTLAWRDDDQGGWVADAEDSDSAILVQPAAFGS